ncbi:MAG: SusD/RagB family nutrient-binding outer membrane lipoprotein [Capnocytophaga sp.]|nr:SusD/RagB family nutrient-binding outer membrane lipoprotein [Capnocytophaga sp.]
MKRRIYTLLMITIGAFTLGSCDKDFEEINTNQDAPDQFLPHAVFNGANKRLMDNTRDAWASGRLTLPWMQYSAQRNYTEEDRFQYRASTGDGLWYDLYLTAKDYKTIIDLNTSDATKFEVAVYGANENQIAASRIMLAVVFSQLVETFGDVPYYSYGNNDAEFQALSIDENLAPVFVSQEKIYTDILKELKEAVAMISGSDDDAVFVSGDAIFGSVGKMKRFANSLRLRIANRVKNVSNLSSLAQTHITEAIASGVMTSNDDTVGLTYEDNYVYPSPMFAAFFVDNRTDFSISNTFVQLLKGERGNFGADPRLQKYAAPKGLSIASVRDANYSESTNLADYVGMPYGIPNSITGSQRTVRPSFFSSNVLKKNYTEVIMEYAEVCFLLSEVNGWDNTHYQNGVRASMERWGVADAAITTFVSALPTASEANVITQKYIALYMQPHEAWTEYRRTGYPNTLLKVGETADLIAPYVYQDASGNNVTVTTYTFESLISGVTDIPARLLYSNRYKQLNQANYQKALQNMGMSEDSMTGKLIWAK